MPKVYIIGAGPGDPELITLKGARLIESAGQVLFTGSLVPRAIIARARADAEVIDSKGLNLEEIVAHMQRAIEAGHDVARVHTGDPSIFGSTAEQVRRLEGFGIEVEIVPGVSSFTAAAAALGKELTLPEVSQTVIVTRCEGRTPMPAGEKLHDLARHGATLSLFLSVGLMDKVVEELTPAYGADCPVAIVHKASHPDQRIIRGTLADIQARIEGLKIRGAAQILVGRVFDCDDFADSRLYAAEFGHRFRRADPESGADRAGGQS